MQGQETGLNASFLFVVQTLDGMDGHIYMSRQSQLVQRRFQTRIPNNHSGKQSLGEAFHTNVCLKWSVMHSV